MTLKVNTINKTKLIFYSMNIMTKDLWFIHPV